MIVVGEAGVRGPIERYTTKLRALLSDLQDLEAGRLDWQARIVDAPMLHPWWLTCRQEPCLRGGNFGHPTLTADALTTSGLWILSETQGWARTFSRFYRLGEPIHRAAPATEPLQ
jgi:hypothetical protein